MIARAYLLTRRLRRAFLFEKNARLACLTDRLPRTLVSSPTEEIYPIQPGILKSTPVTMAPVYKFALIQMQPKVSEGVLFAYQDGGEKMPAVLSQQHCTLPPFLPPAFHFLPLLSSRHPLAKTLTKQPNSSPQSPPTYTGLLNLTPLARRPRGQLRRRRGPHPARRGGGLPPRRAPRVPPHVVGARGPGLRRRVRRVGAVPAAVPGARARAGHQHRARHHLRGAPGHGAHARPGGREGEGGARGQGVEE